MKRISPFSVMNTLFTGLALSLAYGLGCGLYLVAVHSQADAAVFLTGYTSSFKTLISFGLILGTALIVYRCQHVIAEAVEKAFTATQLEGTQYFHFKQRFYSVRRSVAQPSLYIVFGFVIFHYAQFPLSPPADAFMLVAVCVQYALGAYVGRKLFYSAMMLESLLDVTLARNIFKKRELDEINTYVHAASTLTVIFVYLHVIGYYDGPFLYGSFLSTAIKPLILLPAIVATPVLLIFNFYPRAVLRKLYSQSIDVEIKHLNTALKNESLSDFEKRSYLMEVDRMSREELRFSLQLTLSDLPIGVTILIMVLQPILAK